MVEMINKNLFAYDDYRELLRDIEKSKGAEGRGFWTQIAKATGCQSSYVSRILAKGAHFSQEQTLKLCEFLLLPADETEYVLCLVEHAKSGTAELKTFYQKKLNALRETKLNIQSRVKPSVILSSEALATFYSQWYYLAIHVLILNPKFRTPIAIANALGLSVFTTEKAVRFLLDQGLVQSENGELVPGQVDTHLGRSSPFIKQHHSNWRIAAIESIRNEDDRDLHYSAVSSLSEKIVGEIRGRLVSLIEDYVSTVKPTNDETLYAFNLDFFRLLK
jgi:uncharacterized protein (TIGR02147 family)